MFQPESDSRFPNELPGGAELTCRSLKVAEQRAFVTTGYVHLEDLWTVEFARALADEACNRWRFAELPKKGPRTPLVETRKPRGASRSATKTRSATGPLLTGLHFSLVDLVQALAGRLLVPTFSAYGYYESNDTALLHFDQEQCDITLLTTALGEVGPLHLHPELRGMTMEELGALASDTTWDHTSGIPVVYPDRGLTALSGNVLPHNRPGKPIPELSAVAALCYRSLF